ncbi:MAG: nicotinate-nucleotide--dimethylbenzimidazole phosphoribosyltransferase, partial [Chloroflexota bacterium]
NSTAAACLTSALAGAPPELTTGRGTGVDDAGLARKRAVVAGALERARPSADDPLGALAELGGLEIALLAGAALGAAARRIPVLLDGYIATSAALVAAALAPAARGFLIAGHRSAEPGHRVALAHLGLRPLLELDMRLGEGSGAALAIPLVRAASRVMREMATFADAGVSDREG